MTRNMEAIRSNASIFWSNYHLKLFQRLYGLFLHVDTYEVAHNLQCHL